MLLASAIPPPLAGFETIAEAFDTKVRAGVQPPPEQEIPRTLTGRRWSVFIEIGE
jgi:hypothetical protein